GIAKITCKNSRTNVRREVLAFSDAAYLFVSRTHYQSSIPDRRGRVAEGFKYRYEWLDARGKTRFFFSGSDPSLLENHFPPETNLHHFGDAAERAWTAYQLPEASRQLEAGGVVRFPIYMYFMGNMVKTPDEDYVELSRDTLTFRMGKKLDTWRPRQIDA